MSCFVVAACLCSAAVFPSFASAGSSLPRKRSSQGFLQGLESNVQTALQITFEAAGVSAEETRRQLATIEGVTEGTWHSLPKNSAGRLAPKSARYLVFNYFQKVHGWLFKGLEPLGMEPTNVSDLHDVTLMQAEAPAFVEALLEVQHEEHGLSFNDTVAVVAIMERLVITEAQGLLDAAYRFHGLSRSALIDRETAERILVSFTILFEMGSKADLNNLTRHNFILDSVMENPSEVPFMEFQRHILSNFVFRNRHSMNPFRQNLLSFQHVHGLVDDVVRAYGGYQHASCSDVKNLLTGLDPLAEGRISLKEFYNVPGQLGFVFSETPEYLRQIGALDESDPNNLHLFVANYLVGPSNCIPTFEHFGVCCLNDCLVMMHDLEDKIRSDSATPDEILHAISSLDSLPIDADGNFPAALLEKLNIIADHHGGRVQLHGRLFAQWLHHAFPHECPYPSIVTDKRALTVDHWHDKQDLISAEEHEIRAVMESDGVSSDRADIWSDDEVLLVYGRPSRSGLLLGLLRWPVGILACVAFTRFLLSSRQTIENAVFGGTQKVTDRRKHSEHV